MNRPRDKDKKRKGLASAAVGAPTSSLRASKALDASDAPPPPPSPPPRFVCGALPGSAARRAAASRSDAMPGSRGLSGPVAAAYSGAARPGGVHVRGQRVFAAPRLRPITNRGPHVPC
jgi:hypothetical protein